MNKVTVIVTFIAILILSFLAWHYIFSIYEVKYIYNFNPSEISTNGSYKIKAVAVNSLGWNLSSRDSEFSIRIIKGHSLIEFNNYSGNSIYFQIVGVGEIELELNSRFALNPTRLRLHNKG